MPWKISTKLIERQSLVISIIMVTRPNLITPYGNQSMVYFSENNTGNYWIEVDEGQS